VSIAEGEKGGGRKIKREISGTQTKKKEKTNLYKTGRTCALNSKNDFESIEIEGEQAWKLRNKRRSFVAKSLFKEKDGERGGIELF